ncbi:hypothetical protein TWF694_009217 [Orbilia ellipsospora]|uniref:Pheromone receptor n=1 Tax=Orbilia ellipsospora TaxID=2528407 RepID=A0AAV9XH04_9PEZI
MIDGISYFELSWSILSTIGLVTFFISLMVMGIVKFSRFSMIPLIVSAACAIANGLCYYAFYSDYQRNSRAIAAGFADVFWFIQDAGLSMYSYQILMKILHRKQKRIFLILFWLCMLVIFACRVAILVTRVLEIKYPAQRAVLQPRVNRLHMAYFITLAMVETISAYFLLRRFTVARRASVAVNAPAEGIFVFLSRSAEIRLATLCPIGIARAITYSYQNTLQEATSTANQMDRFLYTLECLYPIIIIVDLLASKLASSQAGLTLSNTEKNRFQSYGLGLSPTRISTRFSARLSSSKFSPSYRNSARELNVAPDVRMPTPSRVNFARHKPSYST